MFVDELEKAPIAWSIDDLMSTSLAACGVCPI